MKSLFPTILFCVFASAAEILAATLTFGPSAPAPGEVSIANAIGAAFDADNVGGSGVNANGTPNNGGANDATTYVAANQPVQGQTFTTGPNPGGYTLRAITVRMSGYTANTASGANIGAYDLNDATTFRVRVGRPSGTTFIPDTIEYATSGGAGNPGQGGTANGPGTFLTFTFKAPIVLKPNTVYAFDLGTDGDYFEMLGTRTNPYAGGTAHTSGANGAGGTTIIPQTGERVFQIDMTPSTAPPTGAFVHPGLLNTEADFERMRMNVVMGVEPWLSNYEALDGSWMSQGGGWGIHAQATITRGATNDTVRLYQDIAVAYGSALRWKVSGDTAYADQAVAILNAWGYTFTSVQGDTNVLLTELYGYQFAAAAEIMRTYPGWAPADIAQFQTMIYNVFYPLANNFLQGHFGTAYDHYWANWDLAAMNTIYAIGVFCDKPELTSQAVDYFKTGGGNGCIDRAVNFLHPGHLGQGQEMGRDQGHATLNIAELATLCQMAWNQGTDLFGYENNRVLSVAEYTAKYNLGQDVPFTPYASEAWLMTGPSSQSRGANNARPGWHTIYNHYVNRKGLTAPFSKQMADNMGTGWYYNGDSPGWDALTATLPPIAKGSNPSGLTVLINGQRPLLSWWGSTYATSYNVKRATAAGGPYTTVATGVVTNTYTDSNPVTGVPNYYVVTASLAEGAETDISNEAHAILGTPIYTQLSFNEATGTTATDSTGNGWNGTLTNGATWTSGKSGNAVNLARASSQSVRLPAGIVADLSDFSISAWVYQNSASTQARIFDFGSGDGMWGGVDPWGNQIWLSERYLYLTPQGGGGKLRFGISRSASAGEVNVDGTGPLPIGQWVHVTVTKSASVATLYVNGQAVGQNRSMPMSPRQFPPTTQNDIGRSQWRGDPYFDGKIDDFRIYRGALSAGQTYTLATNLAPAAPPSAPTNFTVTAQAGNKNLLNWSVVSGATTYTISRSTTTGGPYTVIASLLSSPTFTDTGLTSGTTYYYVVTGANTGGDGAISPQTSAVALPPIPGAPPTLVAAIASSTSVGLSWTTAADAVSYNVKRSLASGGPYTTIASGVTATSYPDAGLTAGTTYYYVVSSVNAAGEGPNSAEDNTTPSDLLVHLKFNETLGATAADASGNGWPGALINGPAWVAGTIYNAVGLASASSQHVTLPTGIVSSVGDCTFAVWVRPTTVATYQRIFDFGTGTANYLFLTPSNGARVRFAIRTASVTEQVIDGTASLAAGAWSHVAVTISGAVGRIYLNGALAGTNAAMTLKPSSLGLTTLNYIGRSQFAADPYLNGSVDDFRIYSHALTASEINELAHPAAETSLPAIPANLTAIPDGGKVTLTWNAVVNANSYTLRRATVSGGPYTSVAAGLTVSTYADPGLTNATTYYYVVSATNALGQSADSTEVAVTPSTLRVQLKFDETTGATAADSSGRQQNAPLTNAPTWTAGKINNAITLAPASSQYATLPAGIVNGLTDTTIMAWVKVGSFATFARIFDFGTSTTNYMFLTPQYTAAAPNAAKLRFAIRTPAVAEQVITSSVALTAGAWAHVAVVLSGTTGTLYVNGVAVGTNAAMTLSPSSLGSTTQNFLGKSQFAADPYLDASLDDFRIYGRAMTAGEITAFAAPLAAPANFVAAPGPLQINLSWNAVAGATGYTVKSSTTSGGPYTLTTASTPGFAFSGLTHGASYYFVVSASNATGDGIASVELSATPESPLVTAAESAPLRLSFAQSTGAAILATAPSVVGHTYQLQTCVDLAEGDWKDAGPPVAGTGEVLTFEGSVDPNVSRAFYRILISR